MSDHELKAIEQYVRKIISEETRISADELLSRAQEEKIDATTSAIRWAILHLVSAGELRFTSDWHLQAS